MGSSTPPPEPDPSESPLPRYGDFATAGSGSGGDGPRAPGTPPPGVPGPLAVFETVRASLSLYGADMVELWRVMAAVIIPVQLIIFVVRLISVPHGAMLRNGKIYVDPGTGGAFVGLSSVGTLVSALVLLVATGAAYRILLGRHLHHPADLFQSFSFALDRWAPLLWLSIITFVVVAIGFICLILPGIYLFVGMSVAIPVLMAEDNRGFRALGRSRELVADHWWHVCGCIIVAAIVAGVGEAVIGLLLTPISKAIAPHSISAFLLIDAILTMLAAILVSPFTSAVSVVLYVDLLVRKDDPHLSQLLA